MPKKPAPKKNEPRELQQLRCERQVHVTRFRPDGKLLFTGGYDAAIRRWDMTAEEPQELPPLAAGHHGWVQCLEFSPDGKSLYSADSWGALRKVQATAKDAPLAWEQPQAHDGWIRALSVREDGKQVATAGRDRAARVWSAADGKPVQAFTDHPHDVYSVALHPDGKSLVTGDLFGALRHWDLASGKKVAEKTFAKMHKYERIQDVAGLRLLRFHDGGKTLICAGAEPQRAGRAIAIPTIYWLDWPSLKVRHTARFGPERHGFVFDLAWHPAGYWAAVTSGQPGHGQFLLLRPGEEKPFFLTTKMSNCHSLAVHPDGRMVVAASNRNSQGNGAVKDKQGKYLGNYSPLHLFAPPEKTA